MHLTHKSAKDMLKIHVGLDLDKMISKLISNLGTRFLIYCLPIASRPFSPGVKRIPGGSFVSARFRGVSVLTNPKNQLHFLVPYRSKQIN